MPRSPPRPATNLISGASASTPSAIPRRPWRRAASSVRGTATKQHLTVYGAAKVPFASRGMLARQIGLPKSAIDLIEGDVGGGFGMRGEFYPEDFLIPFAARHLNRPVKWIEDRREHMDDLQPRPRIRLRAWNFSAGATAPSWRFVVTSTATSAPTSAPTPRSLRAMWSSSSLGLIAFQISTSNRPCWSPTEPTGTYRAPGRFEGDFFRERLFDITADDLGIDP